ncbi:hypothetical protein KOAAANKH_02305 [Brevundimonas sp. NIBR10]|uniref:hypothetical protein n=1 Tax=Brevundimonas sp. NIBR10 TaxID=3015997 RepID=UPI0022F1AE6B|nr:hypothetical protein [Brevundimonas sp. NIBR10]WGM47428.1 hypothetical protein KOAAANKH_02305 [Brevundimonas sp. NIBR10]
MKRANLLSRRVTALVIGVALASTAACTAPQSAPKSAAAEASAWVMTPQVESVERRQDGLMLGGRAAPDGRVVVRGPGGIAYATSADASGRFSVRIDAPREAALFMVETQTGQDATPATYRLLVSADIAGPIALLTPGGPSLRLDQAGPLDVIDGDGRNLLASGRAAAQGPTEVTTDGSPVEIQANQDGRWVLPLASGSRVVVVEDRVYSIPSPPTGSPASFSVERGPGGRMVSWNTPGGAIQNAWFPDPA